MSNDNNIELIKSSYYAMVKEYKSKGVVIAVDSIFSNLEYTKSFMARLNSQFAGKKDVEKIHKLLLGLRKRGKLKAIHDGPKPGQKLIRSLEKIHQMSLDPTKSKSDIEQVAASALGILLDD